MSSGTNRMFTVLSFYLIFLIAISKIVDGREETFCRNGDGKVVKWWLLLKQSGTTKYVAYYAIDDDPKKEVFSQVLDEKFKIDDPKTSPFLRTIYDSAPTMDSKDINDNNMIIAWNDQQPHIKSSVTTNSKTTASSTSKTQKDQNRADELDPNMEETKIGNGHDGRGRAESTKVAHSKGILGLGVVLSDEKAKWTSAKEATAQMYFINHSFPRIPQGHYDEKEEVYKRRFVAEDAKDFFGSNITGPSSKAQHALCISMEQKVELKDGIIVFDRKNFDPTDQNLFSLLDALDTIGPSITLTNYVPWTERFKVYHQLFDVRSKWSSTPMNLNDHINNLNIPRSMGKNVKSIPYENNFSDRSTHAFPLWAVKSKVSLKSNGQVEKYTKPSKNTKTSASLRDQNQTYAVRCRFWDANGHCDSGCLSSAILTSIGKKPLVMQLMGKNALIRADIDDLIASRLIPKHDIDQSKSPKGNAVKEYISLLVVYQSWMDHKSQAPNNRVIIDNERLKVNVKFYNALGMYLPTADKGKKVAQISEGYNHSKLFVSYMDGVGRYKAVAGVSDINRNGKMTKLSTSNKGRGGMILFTSNPEFVRFMMKLEMVIAVNSKFTNLPIDLFTKNYTDEELTHIGHIMEIGKNKDAIKIKLEPTTIPDFMLLPYCRVPPQPIDTLIGSTNKLTVETYYNESTPIKSNKDTKTALWIGAQGSDEFVFETPKKFYDPSIPRDKEYIDTEDVKKTFNNDQALPLPLKIAKKKLVFKNTTDSTEYEDEKDGKDDKDDDAAENTINDEDGQDEHDTESDSILENDDIINDDINIENAIVIEDDNVIKDDNTVEECNVDEEGDDECNRKDY